MRTAAATDIRASTKILIVLMTCLALVSCGSFPTVATSVDYCCQTGFEGIKTFRVEFEEMPEFLKPMLRDEASIVLSTKGLDYVEGDAHAILLMRFVNRTMDSVDQARDEGWETIAPGGGVRFIAEVKVEMKDSVSNEMMWAGTMGRMHNVYEGSYMHDEPARAAMRNAFLTLFADYPSIAEHDYE